MNKKIPSIIFIILYGTKALFAQQDVQFKLKVLTSPKSVHVVGDFNNMSKTANPMQDVDGDNIWEATIRLEPGEYQYRFLIDGVSWIKDPENPFWTGKNSYSFLWVKTSQTPEVVNLKPTTGEIVLNSDVFITARYRGGYGRHGLDLKNSQVLLNGQNQKFGYNEKLGRIEVILSRLKDGEYLVEINARDNKGNQAQKISSYFIVNEENQAPVSDAGYTIISGLNTKVVLNSGVCYDPDKDPIVDYKWKLIQKPGGSNSKLKNKNSPFPDFMPDKVGRYLFTLQISDGKIKSNVDSVDVYAFIRWDYQKKFQLSDSIFSKIYETSLESVSVAGDFNRWDVLANPMNDYNHDGTWSAWIRLDPGEYEYKLVVNGNTWIADPTNPIKAADGWNGFNSVVSVSLNLAPVINVKSFFAPGKIIFDASASYSKIGNQLSFLWFQDINNPQRFLLNSSEKISIATPKTDGTYYFYLVAKDQTGNSAQQTFVLNAGKGKYKIRNFSDSPDWAKDAIVYEVFVRKFSSRGDLKGLTEKIPYLKSLGINCIWLMPLYEGPTDHGYGATNFFEIENDYGTQDDFHLFINKAHKSGIKIIFDFVANHSSDQHPYFRSAFMNPYSAFRDWYRWFSPKNNNSYYPFEFHNDWDTLPNFNYENPNVRQYILSAAKFWANLGVDGFRCDAAWAVSHDFWKLFRRTLKNINPDILLLNEVLPRSPEYHKDEFDMSYDTDFYGSLLDFLDNKKPLSAIESGLDKSKKNYPPQSLNFRYLENHDMERFISLYGEKKTRLAAALLLTIPGTPLIYYGQEKGLIKKRAEMNWTQQNIDLFNYYKKLILLRRSHACFRRGERIKVHSGNENQVLAYLMKTAEEVFLVVLNFREKINSCKLILPKELFSKAPKLELKLENVLTSEQYNIRVLRDKQIKMKLDGETVYLLRIMNN